MSGRALKQESKKLITTSEQFTTAESGCANVEYEQSSIGNLLTQYAHSSTLTILILCIIALNINY